MTAAAFLWFAARAAPGVTFEDSGLLAAAASCFGVPHPPGYPLWTLLAGGFVRALAPLGVEPARATNLFSALCAGSGCGLATLLALRLGAGRWLAIALGLTPALSPTFAAQAVVTEVYALACALQLAFLASAFAPRVAPLRSGVLFGLGVVAHFGTLFFFPMLLLVARRARGLRGVVRCALGVLTGLSAFTWVLLAAARRPAVNWGGIDGLARWLDHVARVQYAGGPGTDPSQTLSMLAEQGPLQWPWFALAVALGASVAWVDPRSRATLPWWLVSLGATATGLFLAVRYPVLEESVRARLAGSHLPLVLGIVGTGACVFSGWERWIASRAPGPLPRLALALLVFALALPGPRGGPRLPADARESRAADQWARAALEEAPKDAALWINRLGATDVLGFPLLYRQVSLGEREDVLLVDRSLLELGWYREQLALREPALAEALAQLDAALGSGLSGPAARRRASGIVFRSLRSGPRPLVATDPPGPAVLAGSSLTPGGVLWWDDAPPEGLADWGAELDAAPSSPWIDLVRTLRDQRSARR